MKEHVPTANKKHELIHSHKRDSVWSACLAVSHILNFGLYQVVRTKDCPKETRWIPDDFTIKLCGFCRPKTRRWNCGTLLNGRSRVSLHFDGSEYVSRYFFTLLLIFSHGTTRQIHFLNCFEMGMMNRQRPPAAAWIIMNRSSVNRNGTLLERCILDRFEDLHMFIVNVCMYSIYLCRWVR